MLLKNSKRSRIIKFITSITLAFTLFFSVGFIVQTFNNKKARQEAQAATRIQMAVDAAHYIANFKWTCKQTFYGWMGQYSYNAGSTYYGVPYQQMGSYLGWNTSLSTMQGLMNTAGSAFYTSRVYPYGGSGCPKYGTDCSGFASYVMGLTSRITTFVFHDWASSGSRGLSFGTYSDIRVGDAVNARESHVRFVVAVSGSNITTIESSPSGYGNDVYKKTYTISQLNSDGYKVIHAAYNQVDPPVFDLSLT